jgi:hypothetical protein
VLQKEKLVFESQQNSHVFAAYIPPKKIAESRTGIIYLANAAAFEDLMRRMGSELAAVTRRPKKFRNDSLHADWAKVSRAQVESCVAFLRSESVEALQLTAMLTDQDISDYITYRFKLNELIHLHFLFHALNDGSCGNSINGISALHENSERRAF